MLQGIASMTSSSSDRQHHLMLSMLNPFSWIAWMSFTSRAVLPVDLFAYMLRLPPFAAGLLLPFSGFTLLTRLSIYRLVVWRESPASGHARIRVIGSEADRGDSLPGRHDGNRS